MDCDRSAGEVVGPKVHGRFTLVEVMVAATVLMLAISFTMAILGGARGRILRAEKRWGREHLLAQAVEYYLLAGPRAPMPSELLPEGFRAECELLPADDLPEEALEPVADWAPARFQVRVFDTFGNEMASVSVLQVLPEEDLP